MLHANLNEYPISNNFLLEIIAQLLQNINRFKILYTNLDIFNSVTLVQIQISPNLKNCDAISRLKRTQNRGDTHTQHFPCKQWNYESKVSPISPISKTTNMNHRYIRHQAPGIKLRGIHQPPSIHLKDYRQVELIKIITMAKLLAASFGILCLLLIGTVLAADAATLAAGALTKENLIAASRSCFKPCTIKDDAACIEDILSCIPIAIGIGGGLFGK